MRARPFGISTRALLAWLAVATTVRLAAWAWVTPDLACSFDECSYMELARSLAAGAGFRCGAVMNATKEVVALGQ